MTTPPIHYRLLHDHIVKALRALDKKTALSAAAKLDAGEWDCVSHFDLDTAGQPIADTLTYTVQIKCLDGWANLTTPLHWTHMGLEWADVQYELDCVLRQHEDGTFPGGPQDPHGR